MKLRYVLTFMALAAVTTLGHAAWQHAHGDSANTGFEMIDTAPARWSQTQLLGSIAPGANPVVGPNGDVYVGNLEGELRAFHADGTPYWTRKINSLQGGFFAAPVVGADGSIYAVSSVHYTDHRDGVTNERNDSFLHKFSPGGAWVFWKPFPEQFSDLPTIKNRGVTTAPPNIWRSNGTEAIIVPVVYKSPVAKDLRLIAFSTSGVVLGDKPVTIGSSPVVTGGSGAPDWLVYCYSLTWYFPGFCLTAAAINGDLEFTHDGDFLPLYGAGVPLPGVAIRPDVSGGPPFVMVTDAKHDLIAYAFSPQAGFSEVHRSHQVRHQFATPPVVLPNGDTLVGALDGFLIRMNANFNGGGGLLGLGTLTAAPTRLSDGGLVVVSREGMMTVQRGHQSQIPLQSESIASAAASCNHFFVATTNDFETFDRKTLAQVAVVSWVGGGLHAPVIGPSGHVYAIASNTLHVFPAPPPLFPGSLPSCALLPPVWTP